MCVGLIGKPLGLGRKQPLDLQLEVHFMRMDDRRTSAFGWRTSAFGLLS